MDKLAIIVPVYNEQYNINQFIDEWIKTLNREEFDLIIINDGSNDLTEDILSKFEFKNLIILNKKNEGHGPTIMYGYDYAVNNNYKFIFQVDSDNQFSKEDFYKIWNSRDHNFDLICGSRYQRNDPFIRIFLTKLILRPFLFLLFGKLIIDPNIPFRLMKREFLSNFTKICNKSALAPNILMSIYAKKILNFKTKHFINKNNNSSWGLKKLFIFCSRLFIEILKFRASL